MKTRWLIMIILVFGLVILVIALPTYLYNRPIGAGLELKEPEAEAVGDKSAGIDQSNPNNPPNAPGPSAAQKGVCGKTGRVNMLMLRQSLPESAPRGADAIRLMVIAYYQPAVWILAMPPDLLVQTSKLEDIESATLTHAFYYDEKPLSRGEQAAVRKATDACTFVNQRELPAGFHIIKAVG
jgi:hypothetical protein